MLEYNESMNLLTLSRTKNLDMSDRFDILKDIRESYERYLESGIFETLEVMNKVLEEKFDTPYRFRFETYKKGGTGGNKGHICVRCGIQGSMRHEVTDVVDMPYMDSLCKLHFIDGKAKNVILKLASSDDLSYDTKRQSLSLVLAKRKLKVSADSKRNDITIEGRGKSKMNVARLAWLMAASQGKTVDVMSIIRNPLLMSTLNSQPIHDPGVAGVHIRMDNDKGTKLILDLATNQDYEVVGIRESLNAAVSLDRALGEVLSRKVLNYDAGTYITPAVLSDIKRNGINCIYVQTIVPSPQQKITGLLNGESAIFSEVPKGTPIRGLLREAFPDLAGTDVMPCNRKLPNYPLYMEGMYATKDNLEFIADMGYDGVKLGESRHPYPFETEILGNWTCKAGECGDVVSSEDMKGWVFYKGHEREPNKLSWEDLLAIYSTIGYMKIKGTNLFMDRDRDFLKRVELVDEAIAKCLEKALQSHMIKYRNQINSYLRNCSAKVRNVDIFAGVTSAMMKNMREQGLLAEPDRTNYIAELSQATHVTNTMKEAPDVMRQIAMPYYGRLCPFETPEGKQLGLVNSKAIGCRWENGEMLVPVRRVIKNGNRVSISSKIEELSVRQEMSVRITDVLQLIPDGDSGFYKDTRVIAKVPNPYPSGDRMIYATVYASDLDYVYAHTECFISAATALIPFACANDAVRDSFGSKMIKSAINLLDPDIPRVQTFMYRDMFNSSDAYLIRAQKNGTVVDISTGTITVNYDGDVDETVHEVNETQITKDSVSMIRYKVREGDRVRKGEILADCAFSQNGVFCTGKNTLVAYMPTGYNYEDAIHVSERASVDFISIGATSVKQKRVRDAKIDQDGMYKYYSRGDVLTSITIPRSGEEPSVRAVRTTHGSGIWYSTSLVNGNNGPEYSFDLMGYNKLQTGDKMSGRHGNKGTEAVCWENSKMPMLANGTPVKIILNPLGSPSRMNIGQEYEAHLGLIAEVLGVNMNSDPFNGASLEEVKMLMKLAYELANAPDSSSCRSIAIKYKLPEELIQRLEKNMPSIMEWAGTFDENGDARLWDPQTGEWFPFPVTIGVSYMLKMKQEVETKAHDRAGSLEESYRVGTGQPPKGGHDGGQALGEMEMWALMAYGAADLIHSCYNDNSDNDLAKCNAELKALGLPQSLKESYAAPRAVTNLMYELESLGLLLESDKRGVLPDVSYEASRGKFVYRLRDLITENDSVNISKIVGDDNASKNDEDIVDDLLYSLFQSK